MIQAVVYPWRLASRTMPDGFNVACDYGVMAQVSFVLGKSPAVKTNCTGMWFVSQEGFLSATPFFRIVFFLMEAFFCSSLLSEPYTRLPCQFFASNV